MKKLTYLLTAIALLYFQIAIAASASVEFIASNNTEILDNHAAHNRICGSPQISLENDMITILQRNYIDQGHFLNVLGEYDLNNIHAHTAENSKIFVSSPYQRMPIHKAIQIPRQMAKQLKQESIIIFFPSSHPMIGSITLNFVSSSFNVQQIVEMLKHKLPDNYNQNLSLLLNNEYCRMNNTQVIAVKWLGGNLSIEEIEKAFPHENISFRYGKAFLVYADGRLEKL